MFIPKPEWLKARGNSSQAKIDMEQTLEGLSLHTVCEEAECPNLTECFCNKTATFMILGNVCTRACAFCAVAKGTPAAVDTGEPERVAEAVHRLGLKHAVITSVTRDDLADGGASQFAAVIREIRRRDPIVKIEVLTPDFQGDQAALIKVIEARPDIHNHNIETVPRLYSAVRPRSEYKRSLEFLNQAKKRGNGMLTKSGIMLGFGETKTEVLSVFADLRNAGCDFLTIGQYLPPSKKHFPLVGYIHPDVFAEYRVTALDMGFAHVASGPLVRSSYQAEKTLL